MHRNEPARILREIFGRIEALANGGDLELKLHQLRIEQFEQHVIGAFAVDRGRLEVFVVQALLDAGFGGLLSHLVVFVGGAFHVIHGRLLRPAEAGHQHLRQADIFCPGDAVVLVFAEFVHAEVGTDAGDAGIIEDLLEFRSFVLGEPAETIFGVARRRAQFDALKSGRRKLLEGSRKILARSSPARAKSDSRLAGPAGLHAASALQLKPNRWQRPLPQLLQNSLLEIADMESSSIRLTATVPIPSPFRAEYISARNRSCWPSNSRDPR